MQDRPGRHRGLPAAAGALEGVCFSAQRPSLFIAARGTDGPERISISQAAQASSGNMEGEEAVGTHQERNILPVPPLVANSRPEPCAGLKNSAFDLMTRSAFIAQVPAEPMQSTTHRDAQKIGKSVTPLRSAVRPKTTTTPTSGPGYKVSTVRAPRQAVMGHGNGPIGASTEIRQRKAGSVDQCGAVRLSSKQGKPRGRRTRIIGHKWTRTTQFHNHLQ